MASPDIHLCPHLPGSAHRAGAGVVCPGQNSWYTHDRLRKAYSLLERCAKHQELFTYLEAGFGFEAASTTNRIEGGINAQLRLLLRDHRGLPAEHMRWAVEWFLYLRSENPSPPHQLIKEHHYRPQPKNPAPAEESLGVKRQKCVYSPGRDRWYDADVGG
ncbi:hypothetical protein [Nesterenkonia haasae]|uniref:hypothetical protein n=1 Tax=Nesterenkonia haasae TaxID=2587813 RepID=UPI001390F0CD|nr:hypothetical protein [Nesterenkonia haasae]